MGADGAGKGRKQALKLFRHPWEKRAKTCSLVATGVSLGTTIQSLQFYHVKEFFRFGNSFVAGKVRMSIVQFYLSPPHLFQVSSSTSTSLSLRSVSRSASGGLLSCEAIAAPGFATASSRGSAVRVLTPPPPPHDGPPRISGHRRRRRYKAGDRVRVTCSVRGADPAPDITW